jgi:hypothetical protein
MNALSIIAICLVSSALLQGVGFYVYAAVYKRRYFRHNPIVDAQSLQFISGKSSIRMANKIEGRQKSGTAASSHKQHQTVDQPSTMPLQKNSVTSSSASPVKDTVQVNK